jgi:precorrin-8X/cobalt-precorrin-8 methylmutase
MSYSYIRDGAEIYRRSFAIIRAESDLARFTTEQEPVAVRVIHASGQVEAARDLIFSPDFVGAEGVTRARLPADNQVICSLADPAVPALASEIGNTRSAAALYFWKEHIAGSVVAIGNAPTALFHLLELFEAGWPRPAAIIGMPVGFVGAAESKQALIEFGEVPFLVARGRRGGSAMTVAAINALASARE